MGRVLPCLTVALLLAGCRERASEDRPRDGGVRGAARGRTSTVRLAPSAQRDGAPPAGAGGVADGGDEQRAPLVVLAGGDVNLGRGAGRRILEDSNYDPFREISPLLEQADLRFVNLESPLSAQKGETQSKTNHLIFTGPPAGANTLARAGIDVVSIANNHAWDYGKKGLFETLANLRRASVAYVGASEERNRQYEPLIVQAKGKSIAIFAVTHIWNQPPFDEHEGQFHVAWARFDVLQDKIKRARREHDIVLVSYHGGGEYLEIPMQWTRAFVTETMRLGVDAIIGHHPHVPHGVGWFGDRPIFYSLGNLVFAMHRDYSWTGTSFMAKLTFHEGRLEVEACPYHILGHTPMLFDGPSRPARERAFKQHLERLSVTVGRTRILEPEQFSCMKLLPPVSKPELRKLP